jgi:choline-sulfatase
MIPRPIVEKLRHPSKKAFFTLVVLGAVTRTVACASHGGQVATVDPGGTLLPVVIAEDEGGSKRDASPHKSDCERDGAWPWMDGAAGNEASARGCPDAIAPDAAPGSMQPSTASLASSERRSSRLFRAALPKEISFLLLTVDTLRPDLGYMGYGRPVSPHIDKLAERSVVYERAYSISTYTAYALPPMMASRYPSEMPRTDRHEVKYLKPNVMLAERLRAAGYHTAGAASHFLFAPELGWIDGFERFARVPVEGKAAPGSGVDWFHSSRGLADSAIQMLSDPHVTSGPFFIWVHFLDPHKYYLEHPGFPNFGNDRRALYDGEIAYTDFHIGRVLAALDASPLRDRTVVILAADHGEAFGEHGFNFHGRYVWDEIVRIPLVVFVPGALARRISRRVSAVDLAPTILDLAGLAEDEGARGQSLAPELFGGDCPERPILVDQPKNPYYQLKRAFIDGDYKLHDTPATGTYQLFDLAHDPGERKDLAPSEPELLERMRKTYGTFMSGIVEVVPRPTAPPPPKPTQR